MRKTRFQAMQDRMALRFPQISGLAQSMETDYEALCRQCAHYPESFQRHLHNNIPPVVSAFHVLLDSGMDRPAAAEAASDVFLEMMEEIAAQLRHMLKLPGLYRLMPRIWKTMMPRLFSPDSGFAFSFHPTDGRQVKFDMTACPYYQACLELDCLELAPTFCTTDDVCYGHMHPRLIWNRTRTIARGADVCDFDLYIPKR